jgi:hypothetical protein
VTEDGQRVDWIPVDAPSEWGGLRFSHVANGFVDGRPRPWPGPGWITDPDERARILGYLRGGAVVRDVDLWTVDVFHPERGRPVNMSAYTDGTWIWSNATTYQLEVNHLAPQPELYARIVANGYRCPPVPEEHRQAAARAYLEHAREVARRRDEHELTRYRDRTPFTLVRGEASNEPPTIPFDPERADEISDEHPRFSPDVETELIAAGWMPGRDASARVDPWLAEVATREGEYGTRLEPFDAARRIYHEFGLLDVDLHGMGEELGRFPIHFYPMDVPLDPFYLAAFGRHVGGRVFPIGHTDDGANMLVVDESGRVYNLHDTGTYLLGNTIDEALELMVHGRRPPEEPGG